MDMHLEYIDLRELQRTDALPSQSPTKGNFNEWVTMARQVAVHFSAGRYEFGRLLCERLLEFLEDECEKDTNALAACLTNLGHFWLIEGDIEAALGYYERALVVRTTLLGPAQVGHPDRLRILTALADLYLDAGRSAEAEALYLQALDIADTVPDPLDRFKNLRELAFSFDERNGSLRGAATYEKAIASLSRISEFDVLAAHYRRRGDLPKAVDMYARSLDIAVAEHKTTELGDEEASLYRDRDSGGSICSTFDELKIKAASLSEAKCLVNLGEAKHESGDNDGAEPLLRRALSLFANCSRHEAEHASRATKILIAVLRAENRADEMLTLVEDLKSHH